MKIGLVDSHNLSYEYLAKISRPNKKKYCQRHGYDFVEFFFEKLEDDRTPHWGRVLAIKKHLKNYDWLFYLDTDVVICNYSLKIESFIDENYDLIVGPNPQEAEGHLSTSGMLFKNTEWSMCFLDDWFMQKHFINNPYVPNVENFYMSTGGDGGGKYYEQSAFHHLYDTKEEHRNKIKVVPRKAFNSLHYTWAPGDFLIHFPGPDRHFKLQGMKQYLKKNILII
jgi:hypothetical protein